MKFLRVSRGSFLGLSEHERHECSRGLMWMSVGVLLVVDLWAWVSLVLEGL